jgi:hypothetical protein
MSGLVASVALGFSAISGSLVGVDLFIQEFQAKVAAIIEAAETIPGLSSDEFAALKPGILERWNLLVTKGECKVSGSDKQERPYVVGLQVVIEYLLFKELNDKNIHSFVGVIHTAMPPTPLCTKGDVSKELLSPSIQGDAACRWTVEARTTTLRNLLFCEGVLYAAYPKNGIKERKPEAQQIYREELEHYQGHLFDCPLECDSLADELSGAFYLFKNREGRQFAFALQIAQANQAQEEGHFGLWFGEMGNTPVSQRIRAVKEGALNNAIFPVALGD